MDDQLRPVETEVRHTEHQHEIDLLDEVAKIVRQARAEYEGGFPVAGRLEIIHAHRILDRAYSGDRV